MKFIPETYTSKFLLPYIAGYLQAIYSHVDNQYLVNRDYLANWYKIHYSHIEMYHLTPWCEMVQSNKDNNKITELRTILQRESQNS